MDVAVGRVVKAHGLRGELVVEVRTDEPEKRFAVGTSLRLADDSRRVTVSSARRHGERLVVRFEGITDRSSADDLRGAVLTVDQAALPPTEDPEEYYDHQLIGLAVEQAGGTPAGTVADPVAGTVAGTVVGTVVDVLHGPGGDLLVVAREGAGDALVPFVHDIVPTVDLDTGRIVITPPDGLLD